MQDSPLSSHHQMLEILLEQLLPLGNIPYLEGKFTIKTDYTSMCWCRMRVHVYVCMCVCVRERESVVYICDVCEVWCVCDVCGVCI